MKNKALEQQIKKQAQGLNIVGLVVKAAVLLFIALVVWAAYATFIIIRDDGRRVEQTLRNAELVLRG